MIDMNRAMRLPRLVLPIDGRIDDIVAALCVGGQRHIEGETTRRVLPPDVEVLALLPLYLPSTRDLDLHVAPRITRNRAGDLHEQLDDRRPHHVDRIGFRIDSDIERLHNRETGRTLDRLPVIEFRSNGDLIETGNG